MFYNGTTDRLMNTLYYENNILPKLIIFLKDQKNTSKII